jgi:hypothetical protein
VQPCRLEVVARILGQFNSAVVWTEWIGMIDVINRAERVRSWGDRSVWA